MPSSLSAGAGGGKLQPQVVCGEYTLSDLTFVGSGGGGQVFSVSSRTSPSVPSETDSDTLLKISWPGPSATTIRNECNVLQHLKAAGVSGVEECLTECVLGGNGIESATYMVRDGDGRISGQVGIVKRPFFRANNPTMSVVSTFEDLSREAAAAAASQLVRTVVEMLTAGVASMDVQLLIDPSSGRLLMIDLSEAKIFERASSPSFLEVALSKAFASEALAYLPDNFDVRLAAVRAEYAVLRDIARQGRHIGPEIAEILALMPEQMGLGSGIEGSIMSSKFGIVNACNTEVCALVASIRQLATALA